jgi:hypothetical protein
MSSEKVYKEIIDIRAFQSGIIWRSRELIDERIKK